MNLRKWDGDTTVAMRTSVYPDVQANIADFKQVVEAAADYADLRATWEAREFFVRRADDNGHYWFYVGFTFSVKVFIRGNDVTFASYKSG